MKITKSRKMAILLYLITVFLTCTIFVPINKYVCGEDVTYESGFSPIFPSIKPDVRITKTQVNGKIETMYTYSGIVYYYKVDLPRVVLLLISYTAIIAIYMILEKDIMVLFKKFNKKYKRIMNEEIK